MARRRRRPVLLINTSYEVLGRIDFNRAVTLVVMGTAYTFEPLPDEWVYGPYQPNGDRLEIPAPASIVLKNYVHVDHSARSPLDDVLAARSAILNRDGFCCMYCGSPASTIDHVHPASRGGENTWLNLIACCATCNFAKADRTPEEAGMVLIREPFVPKLERFAKEQKDVYKKLQSGKIQIEEI